ncbi:MAG: hypothetical protein DMD62_10045 [Gemmatimonadetes bacterium]|nr:MAG: hypothetical protein DMD62_10045 [Gemmatimonadota bacterium]
MKCALLIAAGLVLAGAVAGCGGGYGGPTGPDTSKVVQHIVAAQAARVNVDQVLGFDLGE